MAPSSAFSNLAFQTRASSSKQAVERLATSDEGRASVDFTYGIVWMAGEPSSVRQVRPRFDPRKAPASEHIRNPTLQGSIRISGPASDDSIWTVREPPSSGSQEPSIDFKSLYILPPRSPGSPRITDSAGSNNIGMAGEPPSSWSQRPSVARESPYSLPPKPPGSIRITDSAPNKNIWMTGQPSSSRSQRPSIDWAAAGNPYGLPPRPPGSVRTTGPMADGSILRRFQSQNDTPSVRIPQPIPGGKISCMAKLHLETLGALSTCSYDIGTDSFSNFSMNDAVWGHQKGYHDYGIIQMSTKKWSQGSWASVKDDNGNDFLFVSVDQDHGLVRVWRPNLVAKRVVRVGATELATEEFFRLGLHDDDNF